MNSNPYENDLYTYKKFKNTDKKVNIGIDEAGRGPAVGHMVYGALITDAVTHPFEDSKTLTHAQREDFFQTIDKYYSYIYTAVHPAYLSNTMRKTSLNEISYNVVVNMLKEIVNSKRYTIETVYLDALGPKERYLGVLRKNFPKLKFIVENKADSKYRIVGGASIVAKVTRDKLLKEWDICDKDIGSGYPSDDVTVRWLKRNFCSVFGFPNIVRFSWQTIKNLYDKRSTKPLKAPHTSFYIEDK